MTGWWNDKAALKRIRSLLPSGGRDIHDNALKTIAEAVWRASPAMSKDDQ